MPPTISCNNIFQICPIKLLLFLEIKVILAAFSVWPAVNNKKKTEFTTE